MYPYYFNRCECSRFTDYVVTQESSTLPINNELLYDHLKVDNPPDDSDYIALLTKSVILFAERYMKRDIISRTWMGFAEYLHTYQQYEIRRTPVNSIANLQHYVDDVLVTIPAEDYILTQSPGFPRLCPNKTWPTNTDRRCQAVQLTLTSGYATADDVPFDIMNAIFAHVAAMYRNRGDCTSGTCAAMMPASTKAIYDLNRINDLRI